MYRTCNDPDDRRSGDRYWYEFFFHRARTYGAGFDFGGQSTSRVARPPGRLPPVHLMAPFRGGVGVSSNRRASKYSAHIFILARGRIKLRPSVGNILGSRTRMTPYAIDLSAIVWQQSAINPQRCTPTLYLLGFLIIPIDSSLVIWITQHSAVRVGKFDNGLSTPPSRTYNPCLFCALGKAPRVIVKSRPRLGATF